MIFLPGIRAVNCVARWDTVEVKIASSIISFADLWLVENIMLLDAFTSRVMTSHRPPT